MPSLSYAPLNVHTKFQGLTPSIGQRMGRPVTRSMEICNSMLEAAYGPTFGI